MTAVSGTTERRRNAIISRVRSDIRRLLARAREWLGSISGRHPSGADRLSRRAPPAANAGRAFSRTRLDLLPRSRASPRRRRLRDLDELMFDPDVSWRAVDRACTGDSAREGQSSAARVRSRMSLGSRISSLYLSQDVPFLARGLGVGDSGARGLGARGPREPILHI